LVFAGAMSFEDGMFYHTVVFSNVGGG